MLDFKQSKSVITIHSAFDQFYLIGHLEEMILLCRKNYSKSTFILSKWSISQSHRIIVEKNMTPFILDKKKTIYEDYNHGENDHQDNKQTTVSKPQLKHQ